MKERARPRCSVEPVNRGRALSCRRWPLLDGRSVGSPAAHSKFSLSSNSCRFHDGNNRPTAHPVAARPILVVLDNDPVVIILAAFAGHLAE